MFFWTPNSFCFVHTLSFPLITFKNGCTGYAQHTFIGSDRISYSFSGSKWHVLAHSLLSGLYVGLSCFNYKNSLYRQTPRSRHIRSCISINSMIQIYLLLGGIQSIWNASSQPPGLTYHINELHFNILTHIPWGPWRKETNILFKDSLSISEPVCTIKYCWC